MPDLPPSLQYNGDQHLSYNVARSRLKKAITEYYRSLELLKHYKELNELGFQKILKKFDKTAGWTASHLYMEKVRQYHWVNSNKIETFIEETEQLYISEFAEGHRRRGMSKLRTPEIFKVTCCMYIVCTYSRNRNLRLRRVVLGFIWVLQWRYLRV
jgi:SPX domain protein involved in polyphosphate accumulation